VLIGHSKGMSDLLEVIGGDRRAVPAGSTVVSLTGVVSGTPIADRFQGLYKSIQRLRLPGCGPGDGGGATSLTRAERMHYLATKPLPGDLRYFSLAAFADQKDVSSLLKPLHALLSRMDVRNDGNMIFYDSIIPGSTLLGHLHGDHWAVAMPFALYAPKRAKLFASRNEYPRVVLLEAIARTIEETYLGK
jgi:hypothetical protein